jgi:hypothetical protein
MTGQNMRNNVIKNLEYLGPGDYIAIIRNSETDGRSVIFGPRTDFPKYFQHPIIRQLEQIFKEWLDDNEK